MGTPDAARMRPTSWRLARWPERSSPVAEPAEVDDPPHAGRAGGGAEGLGARPVGRAVVGRRPPSSGSGSRRCRRPRAPSRSDAGSCTSPATTSVVGAVRAASCSGRRVMQRRRRPALLEPRRAGGRRRSRSRPVSRISRPAGGTGVGSWTAGMPPRVTSSASVRAGDREVRMRVAVVGAGLAGLAAARELVAVGPRGRGASRRAAASAGAWRPAAPRGTVLDHGSPVVAAPPGHGPAGADRRPAAPTTGSTSPTGVAFASGATRLPKLMAEGLDVRLGVRLAALRAAGAGLELGDEQGNTHGVVDAVVVTAPAPQAADLLERSPEGGERVAALRALAYAPAVMILLGVTPAPTPPPGAVLPARRARSPRCAARRSRGGRRPTASRRSSRASARAGERRAARRLRRGRARAGAARARATCSAPAPPRPPGPR